MKRHIYLKLLEWKNNKQRNPLILKGVRQTGKTWILKDFASKEFKKSHYFDFLLNKDLKSAFLGVLTPKSIIEKLQIITGTQIDLKNDLIIFDEIGECPEAITSLKYFSQDAPESFITASGSFLGLSTSIDSYPVGKTDSITLRPLSFFEFLEALDEKFLLDAMHNLIKNNDSALLNVIHNKAFDLFNKYLFIGGMPKIVKTYVENINSDNNILKNLKNITELKKQLLQDYLYDIAKHSGKSNSVKIQAVFENVPLQLARQSELKKFIFKNISSNNSSFTHLEDPISWLVTTGLVNKLFICDTAKSPLKAYTKANKFVLYLFDTGLLTQMLNIQYNEILTYNFNNYKGYLAENFVLQEFIANSDLDFYNWHEGQGQIEFITSVDGVIIPIEVKAGINTKAKSLSVFKEKYIPKKSILLTGQEIMELNRGTNFIPIYSAGLISKWIN